MRKLLFRTLISCLIMAMNSLLYANTIIESDYTDEYKESDKYFYCNWDSIPRKYAQIILSGDYGIDPVIECYDKSGMKHFLSLLKPYAPVKKGIDINRPMILHLMVGDQELPVKWYEFGLRAGVMCGTTHYISNRKTFSYKEKFFLRELFSQQDKSVLYIRLCEGSAPTFINPIGPFAH